MIEKLLKNFEEGYSVIVRKRAEQSEKLLHEMHEYDMYECTGNLLSKGKTKWKEKSSRACTTKHA